MYKLSIIARKHIKIETTFSFSNVFEYLTKTYTKVFTLQNIYISVLAEQTLLIKYLVPNHMQSLFLFKLLIGPYESFLSGSALPCHLNSDSKEYLNEIISNR